MNLFQSIKENNKYKLNLLTTNKTLKNSKTRKKYKVKNVIIEDKKQYIIFQEFLKFKIIFTRT